MKVAKRSYRLARRRETADCTREAILTEAVRAFGAEPFDRVLLRTIAVRSGVTEQTVLRLYESKESLFVAAVAATRERIVARREEAVPLGDVAAAVKRLAAVYEEWGDATLLLLSQEARVPIVSRVVDEGRAYHHGWVKRVFAAHVARRRGARRALVVAQLAAATDVAVWKVLRRDFGLGPRATAVALASSALSIAEHG